MNQIFDEILLKEEETEAFVESIDPDDDGELIDIVSKITETAVDVANNIQDLELEEATFILEAESENDFFDESCFENAESTKGVF